MSKLRIYHASKGSMLELVRMQKQELPKAVGEEERIYLSSEMFYAESWSEIKQLFTSRIAYLPANFAII